MAYPAGTRYGQGPATRGRGGPRPGERSGHAGRRELAAYRVLAIDGSGSMAERLEDGNTKMGAAITATKASLAHMAKYFPYQRVGMVVFNDLAHMVFAYKSPNDYRLFDFLDKLRPSGRTNLSAGLEMAVTMLARTPRGVRRQLTVLSDGGANERRDDLHPLLQKAVAGNITIWTISLGDRGCPTSDEPLLRWLAENTRGGRFLRVHDMRGLIDAFTGARGRR